VRQNVAGACVYNFLALPLAALGMLTPIAAVAATAAATAAVAANTLLLGTTPRDTLVQKAVGAR